MRLTTEALKPFQGGQLEVQKVEGKPDGVGSIEAPMGGYLFRGEISHLSVSDEFLTVTLAWTAHGEGFPPIPSRWSPSDRKSWEARLALFHCSNIGPGRTGGDRLCLMDLDGNETAILYPPDGSRLERPK